MSYITKAFWRILSMYRVSSRICMLNYVSEEADCNDNVKFEYSDSLYLDVAVAEDGTNNFILNVYRKRYEKS